MEKKEITLKNAVLDNTFRDLADQVKRIGEKHIEYTRGKKDSTGADILTRFEYISPEPTMPNTRSFQVWYRASTDDGHFINLRDYLPVIVITGYQTEPKTVLIKANWALEFQMFFNEIWNYLLANFDQAPTVKAEPTKKEPSAIIQKRREKVKELYEKGELITKIANEVKKSISTVKNDLREMGLSRKK